MVAPLGYPGRPVQRREIDPPALYSGHEYWPLASGLGLHACLIRW